MNRIDIRILLGLICLLGALLGFLEILGIIEGSALIFWSITLAVAGIAFLYFFFTKKEHWWAAIPGFTLVGLSIGQLIPPSFYPNGLAFLGGLGTGFLAVYLSNRSRWWAIIPTGTLLTLAVVSFLAQNYSWAGTGSLLFMGLGLTFLCLAVLVRMRWAYIPSSGLLLAGLVVEPWSSHAFPYAWIGVLLLSGALMVFQAMRKK